jgi:hypothetical protein
MKNFRTKYRARYTGQSYIDSAKTSATQDRQKSYVDVRRRSLEFVEGDKVFLKVAPMKGIARFGKKGKLNPSYIGPFKILESISHVTY